MKLQLAYYGNPVLRKKCDPVPVINDEIRQFVRDMIDTLIEYNGIGLAAPQVNRSLRIFITAVPKEDSEGRWLPGKLRVFINPKILEVGDDQDFQSEGCLSIPKLYLDVERPIHVKIRATDLEGNEFEDEFFGYEARCILHENDHINGVLFIDRLHAKERKAIESKLREIKQKYS